MHWMKMKNMKQIFMQQVLVEEDPNAGDSEDAEMEQNTHCEYVDRWFN